MTIQEKSKLDVSACLWFLQVVIVLSLISIVIWLSLRPKNPEFFITNANIPASDSSNSTVHLHHNAITQNSSGSFTIEVRNPNKNIGIFYDNIYVTFSYNDAVIGSNSLPGFYQGHKNSTLFDVPVSHGQYSLTGAAAGNVKLKVDLTTSVRYEIFSSETKRHVLNFEVALSISSYGRISDEKSIKLKRTVKLANS